MIPQCFKPILVSTGQGVQPSAALEELFAIMRVSHDGTIPGMSKAAQGWRTGQHQYQISGPQLAQVSSDLPRVLQELELTTERLPDQVTGWEAIRIAASQGLTVLLAGGRFKALLKRLEFLNAHIPDDLAVDRLATLGSVRALDPDEITAVDELLNRERASGPIELRYPTIEADLATSLVRAKAMSLKPHLRYARLWRICTPQRRRPEGNTVEELQKWRPDPGYDDTVDALLAHAKRVNERITGAALVVTSGPAFSRYQWVTEQRLPDCRVYTIGYPMPSLNLGQYLNEVALLLYEVAYWLEYE